MNAFNYKETFYDSQTKKNVLVYEPPKQELRVPMILLAAHSNEGPKDGPKERVTQIAKVLAAHKINPDKYNHLKIKH